LNHTLDLDLTETQKLLFTPRIKQAIDILKMNLFELFEYTEKQLEENPLLEIDESRQFLNGGISVEEINTFSKKMGKRILFNDYQNSWDDSRDSSKESCRGLTLKEHLLFQLHVADLTWQQKKVGEYFIDNIDDNGYLTVNISEAISIFKMPVSKVVRVLKTIQNFDPSGIGARDLKECIMIQLAHKGYDNDITNKIIENHLNELAENKIAQIAQKTGLKEKQVKELANIVRKLEPKPGRAFSMRKDIKYIIPDVIVTRAENSTTDGSSAKNNFSVHINEDANPSLTINYYYKKIMESDISNEAREFIQMRIESALWLLKCLEHRKRIICKIADCIVRKQADFFEKGVGHLRSISLKSIAREVKIHESTLGKILQGKYISTPWGIFEMRYFFFEKSHITKNKKLLKKNASMCIQKIINMEDKENPLSDAAISKMLAKKGFDVSRRTVARYRKSMNIPAYYERRKKR